MTPMSFRLQSLAAGCAALLLVAGCSTNPATGKRQLSLIGEGQEIEMGRQADREIVSSMGLYPDEELQRYVSRIGQEIAARSERPNLPWTFRVIDDASVNAFALPGGFIYLTRGILTHMDSEAEMASVLGHEIGHVTARHSVERLSKAQLTQLGLGLGMILSPELRNYGDLAQTGLGVMFLKFSRDDERQADDLGLRYLNRTEYDPREMIEVFDVLRRVGETHESSRGRLPGWLSTHPTPENRIERLDEAIASVDGSFADRTVAEDRFLRRIDGVVFGENPREGYFKGSRFYHPELAFQMEFPDGWKTQNQKQAVAAVSPNEDAVVVLTLSGRDSAEAAAREFFSQQGIRQGRAGRTSLDGLRAVEAGFSVDRGRAADIEGLAAFVEHGGNVYQLLGYTVEGRERQYGREIERALESFERVRDRDILNVRPNRVEIVTIPRPMTIREFADRYPSSLEVERLAVINQVELDERIPAGTELKQIVGGRLPG